MKYIVLTDQFIFRSDGVKLYRIQALKDFSGVEKDDIGGYIESTKNLSQDGNCWVYGDAQVWGDAYICDNARIGFNARVWEFATIGDHAQVWGSARIHGNAILSDSVTVSDYAHIYGRVLLYGSTSIGGRTIIKDGMNLSEGTFNCNGVPEHFKEPTKAQMRENTIDEAYKIDNLELVIYEKDKMINDVVAEILFHNVNEQYKQVIGYWLNSDISKFILHTDLEIDTDEVDWYDLKELIVYGINYLSDMEKKEDTNGLAYIESIKNEVKKLIPQVESIVAIGSCIDNLNNILNDLKQIVED
jgi:acetyltransferase-like isoleucine patch superfamily enzyme